MKTARAGHGTKFCSWLFCSCAFSLEWWAPDRSKPPPGKKNSESDKDQPQDENSRNQNKYDNADVWIVGIPSKLGRQNEQPGKARGGRQRDAQHADPVARQQHQYRALWIFTHLAFTQSESRLVSFLVGEQSARTPGIFRPTRPLRRRSSWVDVTECSNRASHSMTWPLRAGTLGAQVGTERLSC